jgi:hypothetical protein
MTSFSQSRLQSHLVRWKTFTSHGNSDVIFLGSVEGALRRPLIKPRGCFKGGSQRRIWQANDFYLVLKLGWDEILSCHSLKKCLFQELGCKVLVVIKWLHHLFYYCCIVIHFLFALLFKSNSSPLKNCDFELSNIFCRAVQMFEVINPDLHVGLADLRLLNLPVVIKHSGINLHLFLDFLQNRKQLQTSA